MAPTEAPRTAVAPVLDGVLATMVLAGSGADVVKGEDTEDGNDTRQWGPPFQVTEVASRAGAFWCRPPAQTTSRRRRSHQLDHRSARRLTGPAAGYASMPTGLGSCLVRVSDVGRHATGPHEQTSTDQI
ncbi:CoA transferase [Streptomyces sp. NPDC088196]|uniref:CoA transferase n=1 Tax=Streptomyces sp. NPDC088196 TaxID=3154868 RepID=UPI00344E008A